MACGAATEDEAYQLYEESKDMLSRVGFNPRKFVTYSSHLQGKINARESSTSSLECKVLGVQWDVSRDLLIFDVSTVIEQLNVLSPTKRSVFGAVRRFYDPLAFCLQLSLSLSRHCTCIHDT